MASNDQNFASVAQSAVLPRASIYVPGMTIAAHTSFSTGAFFNPQQASIAAGANLSTAGTLSIQRYVDQNGLIPQGPPITLALQAGVPASVTIGDGVPFLSYSVSVTPTNGVSAVLTTLAITLRASEAYGGGSSLPFAQDLQLAELRIMNFQLSQLINSTQEMATLRQNMLTEMGSPAAIGLGTL